ncbi:MAG: AI-2E family transporter [Thermoleophilaceae bacterium]
MPSRTDEAVGAAQTVTVGVFSGVVQLVTALVVTFLLLLDGRRLAELFFAQLNPARVREARTVADRVYKAVAGYVIGNAAISLMAGLSAYVVLRILGVPFAGALAVVMGLLDLVPDRRGLRSGRHHRDLRRDRGLPHRADRLGSVLPRLPAGGEQRAPADRLPAHGGALPAVSSSSPCWSGECCSAWSGALLAIPTAAALEILVETYRPLRPPPEDPPLPPADGGPELGAA